ncbi:alpha/beta-hydrolase [Tothia fuscella]|uniref:Alpha/beta-hydrolase n=1 Tax=Tothia fuscella TaxID=1048955 RepID=A0A9P4P3Q7_9PEZI|nr:alpha/beta-hydrolase [Tothia fuscella]
MASNQPAQCCTIGVKHEGEANGKLEMIGDIETYITHPSEKSDKGILIIPDVIGHKFRNAQLIADQFAANGYLTFIPDIFRGDAIPLNRPGDFDFKTWSSDKGVDKVDPIIEAVIKEMRTKYGIKKLGGVGYCFGGKSVIRFLRPGVIDVGYVAHPSFVAADEVKALKGPLSIAAAQTDAIFPTEKRRETEEILMTLDTPWQINLYSHVEHGFAVRADLTKPRIKWAKEQAFLQAVAWFDEDLKKDNAKL